MSGPDDDDKEEGVGKDGAKPVAPKEADAAPDKAEESAAPAPVFKPVDVGAPVADDAPLAAPLPEVAPGGANLFEVAAASREGEAGEVDPLFDYLLTPRDEFDTAAPIAPAPPSTPQRAAPVIQFAPPPKAVEASPPEPDAPTPEPVATARPDSLPPMEEVLAALEEKIEASAPEPIEAIPLDEPAEPPASIALEPDIEAASPEPFAAPAQEEPAAPLKAFEQEFETPPPEPLAAPAPDEPAAPDDVIHDAPLETLAEIEAGAPESDMRGFDEPIAPLTTGPVKGRSLWEDSRRRLFRNPAAVASLYTVGALVVIAALGPFLWVHKVGEIFPDFVGAAPTFRDLHPLGTDTEGRDMAARVLFGLGISLLVGLAATSVALTIGVLWGAVAGFLGGAVDEIMMRFVDMLYSVPFIFFVIVLMTVARTDDPFLNLMLIFVAIGAVEWLTMARIVRGQTIALRRKEFIEAARAAGARPIDIVLRHIVPNVLGPVVVFATLNIPVIILAESFLSFLGLGVQEPLTSLGKLISDGVKQMQAPWMLISPAVVMVMTLLALNFLGDGLRDALDPKER